MMDDGSAAGGVSEQERVGRRPDISCVRRQTGSDDASKAAHKQLVYCMMCRVVLYHPIRISTHASFNTRTNPSIFNVQDVMYPTDYLGKTPDPSNLTFSICLKSSVKLQITPKFVSIS